MTSLRFLLADVPIELSLTVWVGIGLSSLVSALAVSPLWGVKRRGRTWREELRLPILPADSIQAEYEREWLAAVPLDKTPLPGSEKIWLESTIRSQFNSSWSASIAIGLAPFLIGLGVAVYSRAETGTLGLFLTMPILVGIFLTLSIGIMVWQEYAAAHAVFDESIARLKKRLREDLEGNRQEPLKELIKLKDELELKNQKIVSLEQEVTQLRSLLSGQTFSSSQGSTRDQHPPTFTLGFVEEP